MKQREMFMCEVRKSVTDNAVLNCPFGFDLTLQGS